MNTTNSKEICSEKYIENKRCFKYILKENFILIFDSK